MPPAGGTARSARKARSGCLTCKSRCVSITLLLGDQANKSRRVKCDEQKPSCQRCVATQRICEGYPAPASRQLQLSPDSLTDEERRAFLYFRSRTARRIFGHRDASSWISILLQLGHGETPIKHALTAVASEPVAACSSIRRSPKQAQLVAQMLALKHYTAAIKSVQTESPDMSSRPDITLTLCLLFICFEQFRSGDAACLVHLTAGLKLVSWWRYRTGSYTRLQEYSRPTLDFINNQITPVLQRLRVQFALCMDSRHTLMNLSVPLCLPAPSIPPSYPSLDAARNDFDRAMNYTFAQLERENRQEQPPDGQSPSQPPITILHQWKTALDTSDFPTDPLSLQDCTRKLLELYYHTSCIITETYHSPSEAIYDKYTARFQAIVALASTVTETWDTQSHDYSLLFSFDLGLTPPLFFVASRCRHPLVRRRAVELMLASPQSSYHGAWQDRYSGLCAQRIIEIEEQQNTGIIGDCADVNVPESQRVRKVSADLQDDEDRILMRFARWPFGVDPPLYTTFVDL